jgi:2-methylcitrate dehydratase PrpD
MKDPAVLRERAKVKLVPGAGRGADAQPPLVQVRLTDGTTLSEDVKAVLGTVDNPMTREQVVTKSRELINPIVGQTAGTRLIDSILSIENVTNIRTLRPLLQRG